MGITVPLHNASVVSSFFFCFLDSGRIHEQACILMLNYLERKLLYAPLKCTS